MWERVLTIGSILLELLLHTSLTGMDDDMMVDRNEKNDHKLHLFLYCEASRIGILEERCTIVAMVVLLLSVSGEVHIPPS